MADPGAFNHASLARERTALAWARTALAYAAAGGLAIHTAAEASRPAAYVLGVVLVSVGALAGRHGERYYGGEAPQAAALKPLATLTGLIGLAGLAAVVVS